MISSNLFGGSRNDIGPYRATRLWNDIVRTFRAGMPVGRKRRQLKIYEDVFVASDAVTWLHEYLQQNLDSGPEITRPQTVLLLQKFQRSGVIQDVRGDKSNAEPLEDNGHLFRFTRLSPRKLGAAATRMPFSSRTNLAGSGTSDTGQQQLQQPLLSDAKRTFCSSTTAINCTSTVAAAAVAATVSASAFAGARRWQSEDTVFMKSRPEQCQPPSCALSAPPAAAVVEVAQQPCAAGGGSRSQPCGGSGSHVSGQADGTVWKALTLEHLRKTLLLHSCDELPLDSGLIKAADIVQNVQQYQQQLRNSSGATCVLDKRTSPATSDSLPGWLAMAMRCLARWPQRADDDLPQYPGYEKDVYAMVKDYFESQPEPMVPFRFYHVITYAWAQTLVAGRGSGGQSAAAPLAVTPRCEPPPLPPRRRLAAVASSSSSAVCGDDDTATTPVAGADAPPPLVADSCTLFAKLEPGPVLRLPTSAEAELNGSLYYTPPSTLPANPAAQQLVGPAERGGSERAHASGVTSFLGRSPLDFYARQCIARLDVESRCCLTDGALMHAPKRFRPSPPHGGSMPNLAVRNWAPAGSSQPSVAPAASATGISSRVSVAGSSVPTDGGYGSTESVSSASPVPRSSGVKAGAGFGQGLVAGTLKKFASVRDLGATVQSNLVPAQQRFFSASDVSGAEAFLRTSIPGSHPSSAEAAEATPGPGCGGRVTASTRPAMLPGTSRKSTGLPPEEQHEWLLQRGRAIGRSSDHRGSAIPTAAQAAPPGYQPVLSVAAVRAGKRPVATTEQQRLVADSASGSACAAAAAAATATAPLLSHRTGESRAAAYDISVSSAVCAERPASGALSEMMHSRLVRSIQLCLLLLPPTSRRNLQILLRLLHRLSYNSNVQLNGGSGTADPTAAVAAACTLPQQNAKELVLSSFWRSILRCVNEADMDELVTMRIVSFMLDNHEHVMAVPADLMKSIRCLQAGSAQQSPEEPPPQATQRPRHATAAASLQQSQPRRQLPADPVPERLPPGVVVRRVLGEPLPNSVKPRPVTYCEQVTKETYEEQRMSVSERALTELLDNLLTDTKMAEKEKKKKLKQFQKAYPEIYMARFPTLESQPAYMKEQPKIKQPLLARPLRLLRSLR